MPGGKLEPGETPREALIREIREELGLCCEPGQLLYEGILPASGRQYRFMVFDTSLPETPIASSAHDCLAWVTRYQLKELELAPLDMPVLGDLMDTYVRDHQTMTISHDFQDPEIRNLEAAENKDCRK